MKKIIAMLLAVCLCVGLCACSAPLIDHAKDNSQKAPEEKTETEKVHDAVELRRMITENLDKMGTTIDSGRIKSVRINITNTEMVDELEYLVNGQVTKTDVYGRQWQNYFDCTVLYDKNDGGWDAEEFDYLHDKWDLIEE